MSVVTVSLLKRKFDVSCGGSDSEKLLMLASELEKRIYELKGNNCFVSLESLLVVEALRMSDKIQQLEKKCRALYDKNATLEVEAESFQLNLTKLSSTLGREIENGACSDS